LANRLVVRNVEAGYGAVRVLHGVSIEVNDGETVVLLGTNGNGKSTLINCVMGVVRPERGEIYLERDGQRIDLVGRSPEEIVHLGVTLVPEGRRLFPKLTVEENLLLGAFRADARRDIAKNLEFCFEAFPVLVERRRQLAGSMSGGEQQMLTLARALMTDPALLMLDEPTAGLAPKVVDEVFAQLRRLAEAGVAVLMVEQNARAALRASDRGYVLAEGRNRIAGRAAELLDNPEVAAMFLGGRRRAA